MIAEYWSKIVMASVAPIVVISASGLLCLAFYNRLAAIVSRLRSVQRERLHEVNMYRAAEAKGDRAATESHRQLLDNLAHQTRGIIGRAHLIRATLMFLLLTIGLFVLTSLLNGLAIFLPGVAIAAFVTFGAGMFSLLGAVTCAMLELGRALDVVKLESQLVTELTEYDVEETTGGENIAPLTKKSISVGGAA